jgi:hypothetical protein
MRQIWTLPLIMGLALRVAMAAPVDKPADKSPPPKAEQKPDALPKGSADYSKMLALAASYKNGAITFDKLTKLVVAAKLPPHSLGCEYLMSPVPMPPPGVPFDPGIMPNDWEHTFGEVAMTHFAGKITREEYDRLHAAAHRDQPGFPNCGRPRR